MLITDSDQLGDKALSIEESNAALAEQNRALMAKSRIDNQDYFTDKEAARGRVLDWVELLRLIHTANPALIVTDGGLGCSNPATVAIGQIKNSQYAYVTGFYKSPTIPEFTSITEDDAGLIKDVEHGWREVLLKLLRTGAVKWDGVMRTFGDANGQRSEYWKRNTREFR